MWKMGPECAAQHAKCVNAMARNCGVRSACPTVIEEAPSTVVTAVGPSDAAGGLRTSSAAGMTTSHTRSPITSIAVRQS